MQNINGTENIREYKIGNTTYYVEMIFNPNPRAKGKNAGYLNARTHKWEEQMIKHILEKAEYMGHTINFKTHTKSYKKRIDNPKSEWVVFENTYEAIVSQHNFDLVQEFHKNKRKMQKYGEVNRFSGMMYCVDCGAKMYLCRERRLADDQEYLKYYTYAANKDDCIVHFIRTVVRIVLAEINKVLESVYWNEEKFIQSATELYAMQQSS